MDMPMGGGHGSHSHAMGASASKASPSPRLEAPRSLIRKLMVNDRPSGN